VTDVIEELQWRDVLALSTDLDELRAELSRGPVTYYCGFDPTAKSLHIGNLVQILTMRRIQQAGHLPLALVGGATGLIGDPRPESERQLQDRDTVAEWVEGIRRQIEPYLDFTGTYAARMVNNLDWTSRLSAIDFLRDVGKYFRVNRMLAKDAVSARLNSDAGISYTEFSYQILQGYDFLELFRRYGCRLQTGGSDQWGNLTAGTELIRRVTGESAHLIATPLITDEQGNKLGKSTGGGAMWLDPTMTSPYAMYQYFVNVGDAKVGSLLRTFTFLEREEISAMEKETAERPHLRAGQKKLAEEITRFVHGSDELTAVVAASGALFGRGDLAVLPESTLRAALSEAGLVEAPRDTSIAELFRLAGLVAGRGEARRVVAEGGAYVNNERVTDADVAVAAPLHGKYAVLRRGKRTLAGATLLS
jgi:tyrosyl-tRNA synthetase